MKILVLGGSGMLGHQLLLNWRNNHDIHCTLRHDREYYASNSTLFSDNVTFNFDVLDDSALQKMLASMKPDAVVNCVGIIKQSNQALSSIACIETNALFPHKLAAFCNEAGVRLVHLSTDCVFSGKKGMYLEEDFPDAHDLYGRTKLLGELHESNTVTLRTSIIGLELYGKKSLIEWFLSQSGTISGYSKAIYTGFTTIEMARIIEMLLLEHPGLSGLYHVASEPISKYQLLTMLCSKLGRRDIIIEEDKEFVCDRSLCSKKFQLATHYNAPGWSAMLTELAQQIQDRDKS